MMPGLEWKCLWAIADDYEEVPQIKLVLKNIAGLEVPAEDVSAALRILVGTGLARAYSYDSSKQNYVPIPFTEAKACLPTAPMTWLPGQETGSRLWFYITETGLEALKNHHAPWIEE